MESHELKYSQCLFSVEYSMWDGSFYWIQDGLQLDKNLFTLFLVNFVLSAFGCKHWTLFRAMLILMAYCFFVIERAKEGQMTISWRIVCQASWTWKAIYNCSKGNLVLLISFAFRRKCVFWPPIGHHLAELIWNKNDRYDNIYGLLTTNSSASTSKA